MAWIESHTVLNRHRKVRDLAVILSIKPVYALGHLHALWHTALEQQEDGDIRNWSDTFLASAADFEGDPVAFRKALEDIHWLDSGLIHDWLDYAGRFLRGKYAGSNLQRLKEIWAVHGRRYGKPTRNQHKSNKNPITPNHTIPNLPNLTNSNKSIKGGFSKPTPEEITDYAKSIGFNLSGSRFFDYYEANGWRVGKNPMKDWKAVVRTWKRNQIENGGLNNATDERQSLPSLTDQFERARQFRKNAGLRKISETSPRTIFDGIRNSPMDENAIAERENTKSDGI